jgi:hypothetical protein
VVECAKLFVDDLTGNLYPPRYDFDVEILESIYKSKQSEIDASQALVSRRRYIPQRELVTPGIAGLVGDILHYSFDDIDVIGSTVKDTSLSVNDGTYIGGTDCGYVGIIDTNGDGNVDQACNFDGIDDYIQSTSGELKTLNEFTISYWFNTDSTSYSTMMLWQGDNAGNGYGSQSELHLSFGGIGSINDVLAGYFGSGGGTTNKLINEIFFNDVTDNWHHISYIARNLDGLGVCGGTTDPCSELYLDGFLVNIDWGTTSKINRGNWDSNLRIGRPGSSGSSTNYYDGMIDDLNIFSRALNSDEVKTLASGVTG